MTCPAIAPAHFSQAGARCEREPHGSDVNHRVSPTADKAGAVWTSDPVAPAPEAQEASALS